MKWFGKIKIKSRYKDAKFNTGKKTRRKKEGKSSHYDKYLKKTKLKAEKKSYAVKKLRLAIFTPQLN